MICGIYAIFDFETDECLYVGQSKDVDFRLVQHFRKLRSGKHLKSFADWFESVGRDESRVVFSLLEECKNTDKAKNVAEMKWFRVLEPKFFGKQPSLNDKWEHSKETKDKIAKGNIAFLVKNNRKKEILFQTKLCDYCHKKFQTPAEKPMANCSSRCAHNSRIVVIDKSTLIKLYIDKKMGTRAIGNMFNTSDHTILKRLREHGIPVRRKNERYELL